MILYPALDLLDGEVVRLVQGDFTQKTVFPQKPEALFAAMTAAGATHAHLVDLSGARDPSQRQTATLTRLLSRTALKVQVGGGVRRLEDIRELLAAGADRVVLGSLAVDDSAAGLAALERFTPSRLTLALDIRLDVGEAIVMTQGWARSSGRRFEEVLEPFYRAGLRRVLCTDIQVDGRPVGPNLALYNRLRKQFPELELQASGGVHALEDLRALREIGLHSAVVGRALLSGAFILAEALSYAQ